MLGVHKKDAPEVGCAAFSADSRRIVTGEGGWAKEWNADNGQELRSIKLHELEKGYAWVLCVCYASNGDVISGGNDNLVKIWRTDGKVLTLKGHEEAIVAISVSKNGKRVVSADSGGNVKVWDAAGTELVSFLRTRASSA